MSKIFKLYSALSKLEPFLNRRPHLWFGTGFFVLAFLGGVFEWLFQEPRGIHFIRQTDSLAYMMGYYQFDAPFFEPRVYSILGEGGRSASEFPIIYYVGALLAKLFGPGAYILRCLYFVLAFLGVWSFFGLCNALLHRFLVAFAAAMTAFVSVVFFYYASGIVPDTAALSFALIGYYFFYRTYEEGKKKLLWLAVLAFTLSALQKITFLLYPLAIPLALYLFFPPNDIRSGLNRKQWMLRSALVAGIPLLLSLTWVLYARYYNARYGNDYFLMSDAPVWAMSSDSIALTWKFMKEYWAYSYFKSTVWWFWVLAFVVNLFSFPRVRGMWSHFHWVLLAGSLVYMALFFRQFMDHDYYFLLFLGYFGFSALAFFLHFRKLFPRLYNNLLFALVFVVLLVAAADHAGGKMRQRLNASDGIADPCRKLEGMHTVLDSLGIPADARFVVLGDLSMNGSLYYLRRQGYVFHDTARTELGRIEYLAERHHYDYALAMDGHSFGKYRTELGMELIWAENGQRVYRLWSENPQ